MQGVTEGAVHLGRLEIRLFGPLFVRRSDGSVVDMREWRTGKTADLVRLLALAGGQTVPVEVLSNALWPDVDDEHSRASLRTAVAQVRRVLGKDSVDRRPEGLALTAAWVDTVAFMTLVTQAGRQVRSGRLADAVVTTREALALYVDDFRSQDATAEWSVAEAEQLADARRSMVAEAADAALDLGLMRDAWDLARFLLRLDPMSEHAHRVLMQAHAGLGEIDKAVRVFEECRRMLRNTFGVDPSPQTMAAHLQTLSTPPRAVRPVPMIGRVAERAALTAAVTDTWRHDEVALVEVRGVRGAGRTRMLDELVRVTGDEAVVLRSATPGDDGLARVSELVDEQVPSTGRLLVVVDDAQLVEPAGVDRLLSQLASRSGSAVLAVSTAPGADGSYPVALSRWPQAARCSRHVVELQPLGRDELLALAVELLAGEPSPALAREIEETTGCWPGPVVDVLTGWIRAGRVALTSRGMVLMPPRGEARGEDHGSAHVLRSLERLDALEGHLTRYLSAAARPIDADRLVRLLDAPASKGVVQAALDRLMDLAVITSTSSGYVLRDPMLGDAALAWLRPTERRALHQRLAESGGLPLTDQVQHWVEAGEPGLACAAALDAADEAMAGGRYDDARYHLQRVCDLADLPDAAASDQVGLFERLGDVNVMLGRVGEARTAYSFAVSIARRSDDAGLERLTMKRDSSSPVKASTALRRGAGPTGTHDSSGLLREIGHSTASWPTVELEQRLRAIVDEADQRADPVRRVDARLLLAALVHTPRHNVAATQHWTRQVLALTVHPGQRARALAIAALPRLLLGEARAVVDDLDTAARLAEAVDDVELLHRVNALRLLAAHDLGDPAFHQLRGDVLAPDGTARQADWSWLAIRVQTERNELEGAARAAGTPVARRSGLLSRKLREAAVLQLQDATGSMGPQAVATARRALAESLANNHLLLVPEVCAHLAMVEARGERSAASAHFDIFDRVVLADDGHPREHMLRLLARAFMRLGAGDVQGAMRAVDAAAELAERHGLLALVASSQLAAARELALAGRAEEALRLRLAADDLDRAVGAPPAVIELPSARSSHRPHALLP